MKNLAVLMTALLVTTFPLPAQSSCAAEGDLEKLEGQWVAAYPFEGALFEFILRFEQEDGCLKGATAMAIGPPMERPLTSIRIDGDRLEFRDERVLAFRGTVDDDAIGGVLEFSEASAQVQFAREGSAGAGAVREKLREAINSSKPAALVSVDEGPARESVDRLALSRLLRAAQSANTHSLAVLQDGELVGTWHAGGKVLPSPIMSITKIAVGLAVGWLVTTGAIPSVDMPVGDVLPEWSRGERSRLTIRHLLTHTSGLRDGQPLDFADDSYAYALNSHLVEVPGKSPRYNNNALNLLAAVVAEIAGRPIDEFVADELFAPLAISEFAWEPDRAGNPPGMTGISLLPADLAKLGQLVLQDGRWGGQQLIAPEWMKESVSPQTEQPARVGLVWALIRREGRTIGYKHSGALGQYLVVYPEKRLVGVRLIRLYSAYDMESDGFQEFPRLIWELRPTEEL